MKTKDIMTKEVVTVKPEMTIEELARLFTKHDISGAPVVDEAGGLIGIVTENDLIKMEQRLHIPTIITGEGPSRQRSGLHGAALQS